MTVIIEFDLERSLVMNWSAKYGDVQFLAQIFHKKRLSGRPTISKLAVPAESKGGTHPAENLEELEVACKVGRVGA